MGYRFGAQSSSTEAWEGLEDAREDVVQFETGLWWGAFSLVASVVLVLGGAAVQEVVPLIWRAGVAGCFLGSFGSIASLIFGAVWLVTQYDHGEVYDRRRRAKREYDRACRREAEEWAAKSKDAS